MTHESACCSLNAAVDAGNKLNILGGGWEVTGVLPETGPTAPCALVVVTEFSATHAGEAYSFEVSLHNSAHELVLTPSVTGELSPLRIGQPWLRSPQHPRRVCAQFPATTRPWSTSQLACLPQQVRLTHGESRSMRMAIRAGHHLPCGRPDPWAGHRMTKVD
jgi:hypothetical protein